MVVKLSVPVLHGEHSLGKGAVSFAAGVGPGVPGEGPRVLNVPPATAVAAQHRKRTVELRKLGCFPLPFGAKESRKGEILIRSLSQSPLPFSLEHSRSTNNSRGREKERERETEKRASCFYLQAHAHDNIIQV